jgi:DNA repair exonuclease SbcCD ATPase subunit
MAQDEAIIRSGSLATDAQNAAAYQTAIQARQAAEDKRDKLSADVERLEALVTLLGPKGVRAAALQDAVADFEGAINAGLDGFGFKLAIQAEPWEVAISRDGVTFLPFELLSDGEKLWTGVAFQQALAAVTGLGFLAVDATETVVGLNRAMLTRVIMLSPVDQIVIAMAKGEGESLPEIDGLTVIPVSTPGGGPA